MNSKIKGALLCGLFFAGTLNSFGQSFIPSTSPQTLYPTTGTLGLNLDKNNTKYLSNASFPGSGTVADKVLQVAGWSTDNNGGFSYGYSNSVLPYTYVGKGAISIPGARDVQVGIMKLGSNNYIIAGYYDVLTQQYAYDLYSLFIPSAATFIVNKLYTYHFENPDVSMPAFVATTDYTPTPPPSSPMPPSTSTTMGYNRISLDVNIDGNKVVMVMTNNDNSYLYLAAGEIAVDTVIFSPNLPGNPVYGGVSSGAAETVLMPVSCTFGAPWVSGGGGSYWDYFDAATGRYVRYISGQYYYSYYPMDRNLFITVTDGVGNVISRIAGSGKVYNPLVGIKANSYITTPGRNTYFKEIWPDVCFNGNYVSMVYYVNNPDPTVDSHSHQPNGAEDLYVSPHNDFSYFYDYTGADAWGPTDLYLRAGPNHLIVEAFNTFDKKIIRESPTTTFLGPPPTWTEFDNESLCKSLPLKAGEEIRAKIDAPDDGSDHYAVTFAYSGVSTLGYSAYYPGCVGTTPTDPPPASNPHFLDTSVIVFAPSESGKKNIIVRYDYSPGQAILTNGTVATGHVAINTFKNSSPSVAYDPNNNRDFAVSWISEKAAAGTGNTWSYIGMELNSAISPGASGFLRSSSDYLRIPTSPSLTNYSGLTPLISLSKRNNGIANLYTCFSQQDASTSVYSIQHKNHLWSTLTAWRPTGINEVSDNTSIAVLPNPFSNSLHIIAEGKVTIRLTNISGQIVLSYAGSSAEINRFLDRKVEALTNGVYLLNTINAEGYTHTFKVVKQ